eukprot:3916002-Pyramimonas_sp.AAC.1
MPPLEGRSCEPRPWKLHPGGLLARWLRKGGHSGASAASAVSAVTSPSIPLPCWCRGLLTDSLTRG